MRGHWLLRFAGGRQVVGAQITSHLSLFLVERKMAVKDSAEWEAEKRREARERD